MKFKILTLSLLCFFSLLLPPSLQANEPFAPFSVEGNPEYDYYFDFLFPLFRFIKPPQLKVYENMDRSRNYENHRVCPGPDSDHRDNECSWQNGKLIDGCDGGDVDICQNAPPYNSAGTHSSGSGTCDIGAAAKRNAGEGEILEGECKYTKVPKIATDIKGTDFANENRDNPNSAISTPVDLDEDGQPISGLAAGLVFPKYQSEALRYVNQGGSNSISWGSQYLRLSSCERHVRQLMTVIRAKQTKATVASTGHWPLGWVDWGYQTRNGKTLLAIRDGLPAGVAGYGQLIVEAHDDFFKNAGNLEIISNIAEPKKLACDAVSEGIANKEEWALDLDQAPLYGPSFRQGYVRSSICVWRLCCPGLECPIDQSTGLDGHAQSLYYDISVSQTFGAALDDLLLRYPLEQAAKVFRDLAQANQLIRFAQSADETSTPPAINARLEDEISDPCFEHRKSFDGFTLGSLGFIYDYLDDNPFLDEDKNCPGYTLQPELEQQQAGAFSEGLLSRVLNFLWGGITSRGIQGATKVDDVEPVKYHLITIPDAMGQHLSEIQNHVYVTRDPVPELTLSQEFNVTLSNIADATSKFLYAGKGLATGDARRRLAYFACQDPAYSAPRETSILDYALGLRIGCDPDELPDAVCDGTAFAELLGGSNSQGIGNNPTTEKAVSLFNSMRSRLTPELIKIYAVAGDMTGVPCEILAGIHYVESDLNPQGSLVSGRPLGDPEPDAGGKVFKTLLDTAIYAGDHLKTKVDGNLRDIPTLITALSRYNGGGNSNCQLGYPWPIPYDNCPRRWEGEDDPYAVNWLDPRHNVMYLLFCADSTACEPQEWERSGAFTFALTMYQQMTSQGGTPTEGGN